MNESSNTSTHFLMATTVKNITWNQIILGTFLYATVLFTVLGNLLVLLAVFKEKRLRSSFNFYIVNLAFTDLGVAVTAMSFHTTENILGYWPFGEFMCVVWIFFDYGMTFASVFTLLLISVDRFWSVTWSLHYKTYHSRKLCLISIAGIWLLMLALWLPPCIIDRIAHSVPMECKWEPSKNREFVIIIATIGHHGSCFVLLFCYVRVFIFMRKRKRLIGSSHRVMPSSISTIQDGNTEFRTTVSIVPFDKRASAGVAGRPTETTEKEKERKVDLQVPGTSNLGRFERSSSGVLEGNTDTLYSLKIQNVSVGRTSTANLENARQENSENQTHDKMKTSFNRENKVFTTLSYVVLGYLVCWVPFHIVFDVSSVDASLVPDVIYNFTFWLTYINSTINPILYNFSSTDFRRAFKKILCRHCRR